MKRSSVRFRVSPGNARARRLREDASASEAGAFAGSTPTAENVALAVRRPARPGALTAGDGTTRSALLGEQADSYKLTRAVTGIVNGATGVVLLLVKTIVSYPAHQRRTATPPCGARTASRSTRTPGA